MPDLNGIDATHQIVSARPAIKVICLSAFGDQRTAAEMLSAGAAGVVLKDAAFDDLAKAIRLAMSDEIHPSAPIDVLLNGDRPKHHVPEFGRQFVVMTGREREVLQLIAEGKSTKEIGSRLGLSVKTVESHRRNLMEKLNLWSIAELTKYAVREGITSL